MATLLITPPASVGSGFTTVARQVFTGSGTYTPTAGMDYCVVEMVGGGGGGGGADGVGSNDEGHGMGGGGGGEYRRGVFTAADIGASQTVTIGAAGAAGGATGGNGGTGGTTSVGTLLTAVGGTGGAGSGSNSSTTTSPALGGAGGTGGTGTGDAVVGEIGQNGMAEVITAASLFVRRAGKGGNSLFGWGGRDILTFNGDSAGNNGTGFGGGGSGAIDNDTTGSAGGAGTTGYVRILEFT